MLVSKTTSIDASGVVLVNLEQVDAGVLNMEKYLFFPKSTDKGEGFHLRFNSKEAVLLAIQNIHKASREGAASIMLDDDGNLV
jgi:hypothetical protein